MPSKTEIQKIISIQKYENQSWKPVYSLGYLNVPIYPASVSKIFVGVEVLRQVELNVINIADIVTIKDNNVANFLESEFPHSSIPLLNTGDKKTVNDLLFLMLNRSDDTATNELIDLVTRESININTIQFLGMSGSEIMRKYCTREKEDKSYKEAPIIMTVPRHVELFFQKLHTDEIHSRFVSQKLKMYMAKETGHDQLSFLGFSYPCVYKGGYFSSIIWDKRKCVHRHFVMTVDIRGNFYSIVIFTISKSYDDVTKEIEDILRELFIEYIH